MKKKTSKRKIRNKIWRGLFFYMFLSLMMFIIVLIDSFTFKLPFYYILFFVLGIFISLIFKKTHKVYWDLLNQELTRKIGFLGILLVIILIIFRKILLPGILKELQIIYITDAMLLLTMGIFLGRVLFTWAHIRKILMS